jgi:uncharacterized membrane protein
MKNPIRFNETELTRTWIAIATAVVVSGILISSLKLLTPYSYWTDELYSVNASALNWGELHKRLLSDVHPPLYQAFLKIWMTIFGDTEPTTRLMSWLFAIGSLFVALRFASKQGMLFFYCVAVCFSANMLFTFYANETRAYAMALFLSTLLLTLFPFSNIKTPTNGFFATAVTLSLTHYFGLILAGVSLAVIFFRNLKNLSVLIKTVVTGLICLAWPIHHIVNSSIASRTGGNFWIKIESPLQTIYLASYSMIVGLGKLGGLIFVMSLVIGGIICYLNKTAVSEKHKVAEIGFHSVLIILAIVSILAVVDSHTPISTHRNYIVIMPAAVFALAATVQLIAQNNKTTKTALLILVTIYSCLALFGSYKQVLVKSHQGQDWKNAIAIAANEASLHKLYYYPFEEIFDHYFKKNSIDPSLLSKYTPNETTLVKPAVIVYGNVSEKEFTQLQKEMRSINARHIFPLDTKKISRSYPGVFVID